MSSQGGGDSESTGLGGVLSQSPLGDAEPICVLEPTWKYSMLTIIMYSTKQGLQA